MQRPGQMWTRRAFVSKPNLCSQWWKFDAPSRCWVEKRPHINDQQSNPPAAEHHDQLFNPDSFLTPALVRSCSWRAQIWRGLASFVGFIPMFVITVTKRILPATTVYFLHGVGGVIFTTGTWFKAFWTVNMKHYCFHLFWSGVQSFGTAQCLFRPVQFVFSRSGGQKELLEHKEQRIILGCPFPFSNLQVFHCNADCFKDMVFSFW